MPATAIVAFFSPCDFALPKKHLAATLRWLLSQRLNVICAQVVKPGRKPEYVPPKADRLVFESEDILFYKENLWNLAARSTDADRLFFFDSDVFVKGEHWLRDSLRLLDSHSIIQPFESASWLRRDGIVDFSRQPSALALARKQEPHPGRYHPGFAWGWRRDAFDALGGWYDRHPAGGSDTAVAYAVRESQTGERACPPSGLRREFCECPTYRAYCENARRHRLSVSITRGAVAMHLWHGSWKHRGYCERDGIYPIREDGEYEVTYRDDGLLQWAVPEHNAPSLQYFQSRREDG